MLRSARRHLLLAVAAALALSACAAGTGPGTPSAAPPAATPQGPAIAGKDRVVVAWCERFGAPSPVSADGKVHVITVEALSMPDGARIARQKVTLPERGSVDTLCGQPRSTTAAADRALFNADFTLIAGTAPRPGGDGLGATAFTVPGGSPMDGPKPAAAGDDSAPAFQPGTSVLWYATGDRQVTSRDLGTPGAAPTPHGAAPGVDFVLAGDQPWLRRPLESKADQVAVSPDGKVAVGTGLSLWHRTDPASSYAAEYVEPVLIGRAANGRAALPGSEHAPYCSPIGWTSDVTLFCGGDNLYLLTFSADRGRLETATALLPPAQFRRVDSASLAPDGRSLAYLASEDEHTVLYRLDLSPGAVPSVVGSIGMPPEGVVNPLTPRLIAWL
ncbi:hypothetical protein [Kitasatospora indigofera]|uniref:hypothetical protein n=1 Tax=Kitasatospora indigofera TaxID=67307 RepID=UPI00367E7279